MDSSKKIGIIGILLALIVAYFIVGFIVPKKYVKTASFAFPMSEGNYDGIYWMEFTEKIIVEKVGQMGWKIDFYVTNNLRGDHVLCTVYEHNELIWYEGSERTTFIVGPTLHRAGEFLLGVSSKDPYVEIYIWVYE